MRICHVALFASTLGLLTASLASHAEDHAYPDSLKLTHPTQREVNPKPGMDLAEMQASCPADMLNASPGTQLQDIHERLLRTVDGVIIETDAEVGGIPTDTATKSIPATYRCEFRDGKLVLGIWQKGLIGKWTIFQNPALSQSDLGLPWPDYQPVKNN